ncbi:MAG: hypothetical protein LQ352_006475 [Teloschistes flavicans]|nr:MAG: hypothetical protein LQ352_006475 [Teloschistes flavicans]
MAQIHDSAASMMSVEPRNMLLDFFSLTDLLLQHDEGYINRRRTVPSRVSPSDLVSTRRTPFLLGLLLSLGATLFLALGRSLLLLLAARILEGLSTAVIGTIGQTLLRDTVGQKNLGRAMGFSSLALSMALLLGPVIGGVLYEYCGYFLTFVPALILLGAEIVLRAMLIEKRAGIEYVSEARRSLDDGGEGEEGTRVDQKESRATASDMVVSSSPISTAMGQEETCPSAARTTVYHPSETEPLLSSEQSQPPSIHSPPNAYLVILSSPRFLVALIGIFALGSIANGFDAILAPYIASNFNLGPKYVAALFLALAIPMLFSLLTGHLTDRYGSKSVACIGLAIAGPALASLSLVGPGSTNPILKLGGLLFAVGVGLALTTIPLRVDAAATIEDIERRRPGVFGTGGAYTKAFGIVNGMDAAGGMAGPLVAGGLRIWISWVGVVWVEKFRCVWEKEEKTGKRVFELRRAEEERL